MHLASVPPADQAASSELFDPIAAAAELAQRLSATAVERDRAGGHAGPERELIRASGLLALSVPRAYGGLGADWATVLRTVRIVAGADSALAHLLGFHHLQLAGLQLYGSAAQQRRLLAASIEERIFWGNALNPLDKRLIATPTAGGYLLNGTKSFASGSVGADWLTISAWNPLAGAALIAVLPTRQPGIAVQPDWDAFGQRQTDSGNVHFSSVLLPDDLVLQAPGQAATPRSTLRSQVAQLIMANLYLGLAEGAMEAARALDAAWHRGAELTATERGEVALAVAEAKVLAHRASIEIGSQLFELTGARSTSGRYGFDRYWRNARVHTLHDPVDYKLRDLGRHALDGRLPEPTPYS